MGFTEPDSAPSAPGQMPQAAAGPAPTPYNGPVERPEPPDYGPQAVTFSTPGVQVLDGVTGNAVQESAYAHDVNAGLVAQFYPGAIAPIQVHGDADAGGRDDVAGTVAGAVANAEARYLEHVSDIHGIGSTIGDLIHFPPAALDPGTGVGNTLPTAAFYDPPRGYGGVGGAPVYGGNEPAPGYQGEAQ